MFQRKYQILLPILIISSTFAVLFFSNSDSVINEKNNLSIVNTERIEIGSRIRDLAQINDTIFLSTDSLKLILLTKSNRNSHLNNLGKIPASMSMCSLCHSFKKDHIHYGPSLSGIYQKKAGSGNYHYTTALKNSNIIWNEENLKKYLDDPQFIEGTSMPNYNLSNDQIDAIIKDLKKLSVKAVENTENILTTQYFTLNKESFNIPKDTLPANLVKVPTGGAQILDIGNNTLLIFYPSGNSIGFNYLTQTFISTSIPPVPTNFSSFKEKFYTYTETAPRVLDAVKHKDIIYISYNHYDSQKDLITFKISAISLSGPKRVYKEIFTSEPLDVHYFALGNGGAMTFHGDDLYFSIGDQSLDRKNNLPSDFAPQNKEFSWGKIHVIKDVNSYSSNHSICSIGHRNPQGLVLFEDILISSEHAQRGGDEINQVDCGKNYGWPYISYGTSYFDYTTSQWWNIDDEKYKDPIMYFTPSPAPTTLIKIKNFADAWNGQLLMGTLKDKSIYRLRLESNN